MELGHNCSAFISVTISERPSENKVQDWERLGGCKEGLKTGPNRWMVEFPS